MRLCRLHGAVLIIAKLDRLSRDAHFLLGLEKAGVDFLAADMPYANRLTVGIMAVVADEERRMISKRTKDALAAAKARGVKLGGDRGNLTTVADRGRAVSLTKRQQIARRRAADLSPIIRQLRAEGAGTSRQIAAGLNASGISTARGKHWHAIQVDRVIATSDNPNDA